MFRDPQLERSIHAPEFADDTIWLNVRKPLSIAGLQGKIVLHDFWTYCCINCLHFLPELKALEHKYHEELVIIGVHSGKFTNEGQTDSIQAAISRYDFDHPVINDRLRSGNGSGWPSFMLINPNGRIIGTHRVRVFTGCSTR